MVHREPHARTDEPTGEPESLVGRIDSQQMGTKGGRAKPSRQQRAALVVDKVFDPRRKSRMQVGVGSVMSAEIDENLLYRPKTKENRLVYEKILALIHGWMPEQS